MESTINPLIPKLGYGPKDRLVIFHADDLGMSHGSNQAFLALHEAGIVKTGSIMVPCPWASEMLSLAVKHPELDVGIHLTLTCEYDAYRWGPLRGAGREDGLTSEDGRFWTSVQALSENVNPTAANIEMVAQIDYTRSRGVDFTHIDTHMAASLIPQLVEQYVTLGAHYRTPILITRQRLLELGLQERIVELESNGMPLIDDFRITPVYMPDAPPKPSADIYETILRALPPGIFYFSLHPNAPGDIEHINPSSAAWRIFEYEYFQSQRLRDFLKSEGIVSVGYREIRATMRAN